MNTLERIEKAQLVVVSEIYIDFRDPMEPHRLRFAHIDKKDFPVVKENGESYDQYDVLMEALSYALTHGNPISLILEHRDIELEHANPKDKSPEKTRKADFLIKIKVTE